MVDRRGNRELIAGGGRFNRLVSAEDVPIQWEAWDIDADWTKKARDEDRLLGTEIAGDGPVCFRLRRTYRIGEASTLTQDTVFYAGNPRIDFDSRIEWRERRRLLKAEFNTVIDSTQVRCEVQYGHVMRNTHHNLPQDRAQFEFCAHKWISLEEEGRGAALLNDCKYGWDVNGGTMRLTLLRSPTAPDPEADQGEHRFVYAFLPFPGPFGGSGLVRSAYELNAPPAVERLPGGIPSGGLPVNSLPGAVSGGDGILPGGYSLCTLDSPAVIVESVKAPEPETAADPQSLILRLYESLGGAARTRISFARELSSVWLTDMRETKIRELPVAGNAMDLEFRPFEIKTILVSLKGC
jgi:alpha-mannosidase